MRWARLVSIGCLVAGLVGCSSNHAAVSSTTSIAAVGTDATSTTTTTQATTTTVPGLGATLPITDTAEGWTLNFTLVKTVDPATALPGISPTPGQRYVGVVWKVDNGGTAQVSTDPNSFAVAVATGGKSYNAASVPMSDCPGFGAGGLGQFNLLPGTNTTGCVAFSIPDGAAVTEVALTSPTFAAPAIWHLK